MALAPFDGRQEFALDLLRAGAGFHLLAVCCNFAAENAHETKLIGLCQAAVLAGYIPSAGEVEYIRRRAVGGRSADLMQKLVNWLDKDSQQPPSLLRQCRLVIRRRLSAVVQFQTILPAIQQLDLPDVMRDYLQFDGALNEVDLSVKKELQTS